MSQIKKKAENPTKSGKRIKQTFFLLLVFSSPLSLPIMMPITFFKGVFDNLHVNPIEPFLSIFVLLILQNAFLGIYGKGRCFLPPQRWKKKGCK